MEELFTRKEAELAIRKCEIYRSVGTFDLARIQHERPGIEISLAAVYGRRKSLRPVFGTIEGVKPICRTGDPNSGKLGQCPILARLSRAPYK